MTTSEKETADMSGTEREDNSTGRGTELADSNGGEGKGDRGSQNGSDGKVENGEVKERPLGEEMGNNGQDGSEGENGGSSEGGEGSRRGGGKGDDNEGGVSDGGKGEEQDVSDGERGEERDVSDGGKDEERDVSEGGVFSDIGGGDDSEGKKKANFSGDGGDGSDGHNTRGEGSDVGHVGGEGDADMVGVAGEGVENGMGELAEGGSRKGSQEPEMARKWSESKDISSMPGYLPWEKDLEMLSTYEEKKVSSNGLTESDAWAAIIDALFDCCSCHLHLCKSLLPSIGRQGITGYM